MPLSCMLFIKCKMFAEIVENRLSLAVIFLRFHFLMKTIIGTDNTTFSQTAHIIQFSVHMPNSNYIDQFDVISLLLRISRSSVLTFSCHS